MTALAACRHRISSSWNWRCYTWLWIFMWILLWKINNDNQVKNFDKEKNRRKASPDVKGREKRKTYIFYKVKMKNNKDDIYIDHLCYSSSLLCGIYIRCLVNWFLYTTKNIIFFRLNNMEAFLRKKLVDLNTKVQFFFIIYDWYRIFILDSTSSTSTWEFTESINRTE
jgi:hypothetical protein